MNLTGNNLEFLYYFVFQYSQLILSLTLGPAGPRGPCGPLTPMAPCGGQHKCVKAHNVCLSCNKQNIYKVFLIVFIISVNFGTEPKVCADYCSPSGFHSPFSINFFIYNLQAIQSKKQLYLYRKHQKDALHNFLVDCGKCVVSWVPFFYLRLTN